FGFCTGYDRHEIHHGGYLTATANPEHPDSLPSAFRHVCYSSDGALVYEPHLRSESWPGLDVYQRSGAVCLVSSEPRHGKCLQPHQRSSDLPHSHDLDCLLRASRAEAAHHRSADDLSIPSLEPDLGSTR